MSEEKDRLLDIVNNVGVGTETATAAAGSSVKEARQLLEEEEEDAPAAAPDGELASLARDAEEEAKEARSSLLPKQTDVKPAETKKPEAEDAKKPALPERPKTYVVKEGDTLYGIAKRFYGTIVVWKQIREANKAVISTDNRLRAGDTLVLPEPKP